MATVELARDTYLPAAPLWEAIGIHPDDDIDMHTHWIKGSKLIAMRVGVSKEAIRRWAEKDEIHYLKADRAACRLGLHPMTVWGDDWLRISPSHKEIYRHA